jgi:GxxExxY protein
MLTRRAMAIDEKFSQSALTEKIIGLVFDIYNDLKSGYPEQVYQNALCAELDKIKIDYIKEDYCKLIYKGKRVGGFYADLIVDNLVVVELKARGEIYDRDVAQTLAYMKMKNIKVGLILLFSKDRVKIKRLVL